MLPPVTLVLGGARSGKSRYAEDLVRQVSAAPVYIATGEALDDEMAHRIAAHKARRGSAWRVVEEPLDLTQALTRTAPESEVVLVDCLTLWLANLMGAGQDVARESGRFVSCLTGLGAPVVLVANETGLGLVPDNAAARTFRDHAGLLAQQVAAVAQSVILTVAGLPLPLKTPSYETTENRTPT